MLPTLLLLSVVAIGSWLWRIGRQGASREDWVVAALGIPALGILLYRAASSVVWMLSDSWCYTRLMPAIALSRGYRLYYPDGEGPLLGWSYGPFMPCVQVPLGLLADPVAALVGAGILNEAVLLIPLFLLLRRLLPEGPSRDAAGVALLSGMVSLMPFCPPSAFWLQGIQVDTFALGMTALAYGTLLGADKDRQISFARLAAAGLLLTAGVFSKQNEFFALAAPLAFVWARDGRRSALFMTLGLALAGAFGFVLCLAAFGWDAIFLNMWVVPSAHPWIRPGAATVAHFGLEFLTQLSGLLVLFAVLVVLSRRGMPPASTRRDWILSRPWILPAAAALLIFPISVLGRLKIGGADNSNHAAYYLFAAIGMAAAGLSRSAALFARGGLSVVALGVAIVATVVLPSDPRPLRERLVKNRLEREYRFAEQHRGEVWFSANPLVTLYTDGKLYHHGYGVYDRTLAKQPPTPRHLRDHLPENLRWASGPGHPFWMPQGLTPIPAPAGLESLFWFEKEPAGR